ncbi:TPA: hypothetical protein ACH3X1_005983 [Trebouxia sp. C0004]
MLLPCHSVDEVRTRRADLKQATSTHGDSDSSTLVAEASVQLAGVLLERLARGERIPVTLELQPLADIPFAPKTRERDLEDKQEITLELMLLGSSTEPKPKQQVTDGRILGKGPGAASSSCELLCHVARATQLPAINRGSKQGKQPAVAVTACIISNDSTSSGLRSREPTDDPQSGGTPTPTPAVTPPLPASANPVWNHCLSCQFAEEQMQTGQLQIALLNETDGTLVLDVQSASGQPSLYVTLCLAKCPALGATALQGMASKQLTLLQTRLASCPELLRDSGLAASWHIAASPAAASPATVSFTQVSATDERQIQAAIAELNSSNRPDKQGNSLLDWAPMSMAADKGWPASHGAQLMLQPSLLSSTTAALVLDLYQWPQDRVAKSDLRSSAVAKLGRARSSGAQAASPNPPELPAKLGLNFATLARTSTSSSNSSSSQGRSERSSSQIGSVSDAESGSVTSAAPKRGGAIVPLGRAIFPVRHLPEDRDGVMAELEADMVWVQGGSWADSADGCHVAIEVQAWDAAQFSAEQLKDADSAVSAHTCYGADTVFDMSLVNSPSYTAHVVSVLTDDLIAKQSALDKLQRAVLRAEGASQLGLWRVQEVEKRNGMLAADLGQLRKLLHEEKSSSKAALSVKGWERLPRDEIVTRACQAVAAVAHEKSRNAELVYRLQQTHDEGIEAKQLKRRFAELQEAHVTQGRLVRKLEVQICDSQQTLDTVKFQEKVIAKLEKLLKQATQERRAAVATATKLQQQLEALDSRLETSTAQIGVLQEDNARLKAFNKYEEIERVQKHKATADVDTISAQCTAVTKQLRAQYSAESESARSARFEELELLRAEKNAEIEALRERQASELEFWRSQRAADSEAASAALEHHRAEADEQMQLMSEECDSLRKQLEDARSREDNARDNAEEFESERLSASMRAEKAEASAIAAQHELIDVTKRYAREIAMLKTRLAEKDAQLMGGFGALSNMQLGGSQGWLGGLPDPDSIAASLPDQPNTYTHTQHPLPRQTAWGVLRSQPGTHASTTHRSGSLGPLGVPQQPSHVHKSADPRLPESSRSTRMLLNSEPPRALSNQGMTSGLDPRPGPTLERLRVSLEGQGSLRKPNQARPVLLPLSTSQNQLQIQLPALQSLSNSADRFPAAALSPDAPMQAASIPAADLSNAASGSPLGLPKTGSRSRMTQQQSTAIARDSAGVSEGSSASESSSDSESEASSSGALTSMQLQANRSEPGKGVEQNQPAALQQGSRDARVSVNTSPSTRSTQSLQESVASRASSNGLESPQSNPAVIDFMLNKQAKKKWRMF